MNIWLFFACMTILPVITGRGVFAVLYRSQAGKFHMADWLITGWLVTIGLAEGVHLAAVFLGWPFSKVAQLWLVAAIAVAVICGSVSLLIERKYKVFGVKYIHRRQQATQKELTPLRFGLFLAFVLPMIWQIMTIVSQESAYRTGDMTVETVESFLQMNAVYEVNPLTGRAYTAGIPLRIQILCLPTFYGVLCNIFGIAGADLVWKYIPVLVLFLSYSAYWLIAGALFDKEEEKDKRWIFMVFVALLFCVGDYAYGMDGFGILHSGYQGVVIRNMVLVPYAFALTLRHKWLPAGLVVLAEACITWTFYGLGASLLVLIGMAVIWRWRGKRAERQWQMKRPHKKREEA